MDFKGGLDKKVCYDICRGVKIKSDGFGNGWDGKFFSCWSLKKEFKNI